MHGNNTVSSYTDRKEMCQFLKLTAYHAFKVGKNKFLSKTMIDQTRITKIATQRSRIIQVEGEGEGEK